MDEICLNCENPIRVSIFRGDHYCSNDCLKELTGGTYDRARVHEIYRERNPLPQDEKPAPAKKAPARKTATKKNAAKKTSAPKRS